MDKRQITFGLSKAELELINRINQNGFAASFEDLNTVIAIELLIANIADAGVPLRSPNIKVIPIIRANLEAPKTILP